MRRQSLLAILKTQFYFLGTLVLILWGIELLDFLLFHGFLDRYGIIPRTVIGLRGILVAPFLHHGFLHLINNTLPFIILSWFIMVRSLKEYIIISILIIIISGLGVWLFARGNTIHIGASGLIFGYFGYILGKGIFERSLLSIIIAIITAILYGSMIWGIFPQAPHISWEGHLLGFLTGVYLSKRFSHKKAVKNLKIEER